jgi:hypothetical protein
MPKNALPIEKHCSVSKFYHPPTGVEHLKDDGPYKDWVTVCVRPQSVVRN